MPKKLLINATQDVRLAIVDVDTQTLLDLIVERKSYKAKIGNIYEGKLSSIEQSLNAAFVNFGSERHGFLPFKEISRSYFTTADAKKSERTPIKDALKEGQRIMVQVEKEERGNKGAALTTFISLAGSYLVLMPNNPRAGGISRRVEGEERDELREILSNLSLPEDMGLIVRTAGVGKSSAELQWDLNILLKQWEAIQKASTERAPPFLIHQESDVVIRTIRDYLRQDVIEIIVDDAALFDKIKTHLEQIRPDFVSCLKLYTGTVPLFNRYQIEHQIEAAHQRELRLPSGGSIVIDHTEALVAIDVNSARATQGSDIEETALKTNMEAAELIACQLRLRDIGGLVVIDFIDMESMRHRREVENHLRNALKLDKARTQVGVISPRFGLLEMSRQRLRPSLGEATQVVCPRCSGWGTIRSIESLALSIIRMIEEDAVKPNTAQIQVQLPIDVATYLINEKRDTINSIEQNHTLQIVVIPHPEFQSPRYRIKRLSEDELTGAKARPSYHHLLEPQELEQSYKKTPFSRVTEEKPAVKSIFPTEPAPSSSKKPTAGSTGIIKRLITSLFGTPEEEKLSTPSATSTETVSNTRTQYPSRPPHKHSPVTEQPSAPTKEVKKPTVPTKVQQGTPSSPMTDTKARTRRGARGGRRRISSGTYSKTQKPPVAKTETPPTHLPPFPSDLEDYYQDSVGFGKQTRTQTPTKPTQAQAPASETPPPQNNEDIKQTKPEPVISETSESKSQETKPLIVRAHIHEETPPETKTPKEIDSNEPSTEKEKTHKESKKEEE